MKRTTLKSLAVGMALCLSLQPTLASASVLPAWLTHLNSIRAMSGLAPVNENTEWSAGCYAHSRYMSYNRVITHSEDSSLPYYSAAGDLAARRSNLALGAGGTKAIDLWAVGPFHGIGMIDPGLRTAGFGTYSATGYWPSAALDVIRGSGSPVAGTVFPVMWPGPGSVSNYLAYDNSEYPDPLAGTGFTKPSGLPIIVQFGAGGLAPVVTASSLERNGVPLAHATYTELTYRNPDAAAQTLGRSVLGSRDAVVLVPKAPLTPGSQYDVSLTVGGTTYAWSFATAGTVDITLTGPRTCDYAGPARVSATLRADDGSALPDRGVTFEQSYDGRTWTAVDSSRTTDAGAALAALSPVRRVYVRATFAGDAALPARSSAPVTVLPRAKLGTPALPLSTYLGRSLVATGTMYPRHAPGTVAVKLYAQRYESGRWVSRATFNGYASSTGYGYRSSVKLPYRGTWQIRAVHKADAYNYTAVSTWRRIVVR